MKKNHLLKAMVLVTIITFSWSNILLGNNNLWPFLRYASPEVLRVPLKYDIKYGKRRTIVSEEHRLEALRQAEEKINRFWKITLGDEEIKKIIDSFEENSNKLQVFLDRFNKEKPLSINAKDVHSIIDLLEISDDEIEELGIGDIIKGDKVIIGELVKPFGGMDGFLKRIEVKLAEWKSMFETGKEIYSEKPEAIIKDIFGIKAVSIVGSSVSGKDGRPNLGISQNFTDESDIDAVYLYVWDVFNKIPQKEKDTIGKIIDNFLGCAEVNNCKHKINFLRRSWEEFRGLYNYNKDRFVDESRIYKILGDSFAIQYCCGKLVIDDPDYSLKGIFDEIKERCGKKEHLFWLVENGIKDINGLEKDIQLLKDPAQFNDYNATCVNRFLTVSSFLHLVICDIEISRSVNIGDRMIPLKRQMAERPDLYEMALKIIGADYLDKPITSEEIEMLENSGIENTSKNIEWLRIKKLRKDVDRIYTYLIEEVKPIRSWGENYNTHFWWNSYERKTAWLRSFDRAIAEGYYKEAVWMLLRTAIGCYTLISYQQDKGQYEEIENIYHSILERFGYLDKDTVNKRIEESEIFLNESIKMIMQYVGISRNLPVVLQENARLCL